MPISPVSAFKIALDQAGVSSSDEAATVTRPEMRTALKVLQLSGAELTPQLKHDAWQVINRRQPDSDATALAVRLLGTEQVPPLRVVPGSSQSRMQVSVVPAEVAAELGGARVSAWLVTPEEDLTEHANFTEGTLQAVVQAIDASITTPFSGFDEVCVSGDGCFEFSFQAFAILVEQAALFFGGEVG